MILSEQPNYTGAMSRLPYNAKHAALYESVSRFGERYNTSIQDGHWLWVPRETAPVGKIDSRVERPMGLAINCKCPPLDAEQAGVIAQSTALLKSGHNHVFEAPTGFGKTYCGSSIAVNLNQATMIVVTKSDLIDEWNDTLINLIGVDPNEIGLVRQNKCKWQGKRFVISMVHSLAQHEYPKEMVEYFGMVIFDETHRMGADTFSVVARMFPAKYRLGISATPERADNKDPLFKQHIGQTMVKGTTVRMKPKALVKYTNWLIKPTWNKNDDTGEWQKTRVIPAGDRMMEVYGQMAEDPARNQIIVDFVVQAHKKGRYILLPGHLIDRHLKPMFHLLGQAGIPAEDMGFYISGLSKTEVKRVKSRSCKVVLATYKMVSEGTNVPHWDALCFLTPIANAKQTIGRIMRTCPGKPWPIVLDLVDKDHVFHGYFSARNKQYNDSSVGATVVWVK